MNYSSKELLSITASQSLSKHRVAQTVIVGCILALGIHTVWTVIFWGEHELMAKINGLAVILYAICIFILRRNDENVAFVLWCVGLEQIIHQIIASYFLGWNLGFQYYFLVVASFSFLGQHKHMIFPFVMTTLSILAFVGAYYYNVHWYNPEGKIIFSDATQQFFNISNIVFSFSAIALISFIFSREANLAEKNLALEKEMSESLLLNILPESIAEKLKARADIIADNHQNVSVLFADIVGFSKISMNLSADELVGILNKIFSHFDMLVEKYELEKIKTIGDAYMVASGLPEPSEDHLQRLTYMSLDMISYLKSDQEIIDLSLEVRVGIHSGPVVAGVIGIKKFTYDLWGDTVNTASRMESHGMPSRITVSEPVKQVLDKEFDFEKRQIMYVKGKGEMQTYFLIGPKAS